MKYTRWLVPLLTALAVLGCAALPQQLSRWQDKRLLGELHTQAAEADTPLFTQPSIELKDRVALLARHMNEVGSLPYYTQEGTDWDAGGREEAAREVERLIRDGILPDKDYPAEDWEFQSGQLFLQDPDTRQSVGFRLCRFYDYDTGWDLEMHLDGNTGRALRLIFTHPSLKRIWSAPAEKVGQTFLERLGLTWEMYAEGKYEALFFLENGVTYKVMTYEAFLSIEFTTERAGMDHSAAASR